jgi:hypothetical protein
MVRSLLEPTTEVAAEGILQTLAWDVEPHELTLVSDHSDRVIRRPPANPGELSVGQTDQTIELLATDVPAVLGIAWIRHVISDAADLRTPTLGKDKRDAEGVRAVQPGGGPPAVCRSPYNNAAWYSLRAAAPSSPGSNI